jgi:hypothetical protein
MFRLAKGSADDSKVEEKTDEEKAEEKKVGVFLILYFNLGKQSVSN